MREITSEVLNKLINVRIFFVNNVNLKYSIGKTTPIDDIFSSVFVSQRMLKNAFKHSTMLNDISDSFS